MMDLSRRAEAEELMDADDLDADVYTAVVADLARVNRVTLAARPTLGFLKRAVGARGHFRLLDVGFGDADMLRQISRWSGKRGIDAQLTGIDLNPRSERAARAHTPGNIRLITGDYNELADEPWDVIVSSLVAHHMNREQLVAFLEFMEAKAGAGWYINDLHRHGFAYHGYPLLARLMRWHPIVRLDGTLSIARSYRPAEWPALLAEAGVEDANVFRAFPFRLCVERLR